MCVCVSEKEREKEIRDLQFALQVASMARFEPG